MWSKFGLVLFAALAASKVLKYRHAYIGNDGQITIKKIPQEPSTGSRVAGGTVAPPHSFPHIAAIQVGDYPYDGWSCCGSLIDPSWVITAAHCFEGPLMDVQVLLGAYKMYNESETTRVNYYMEAGDVIQHPDYDEVTLNNDLALIRLDPPVTLTPEIQPIALTAIEPEPGTLLTLAGWGAFSDLANEVQSYISEVDVPTISRNDCAVAYPEPNEVYGGLLCTDARFGKGGCDGDDGAPLNWGEDTRRTLAGVFSFYHGTGCDNNEPQGSSSIAYFLSWIEQVTGVTPP